MRIISHGHPRIREELYHSQASLEGLKSVECFLSHTTQDGPCVGVILEYIDGHREALGECRVGISKTLKVMAPTTLHLKLSDAEGLYSEAWFTSYESNKEERRVLGWERRQVRGTLTWWFDYNVIKISHVLDMTVE